MFSIKCKSSLKRTFLTSSISTSCLCCHLSTSTSPLTSPSTLAILVLAMVSVSLAAPRAPAPVAPAPVARDEVASRNTTVESNCYYSTICFGDFSYQCQHDPWYYTCGQDGRIHYLTMQYTCQQDCGVSSPPPCTSPLYLTHRQTMLTWQCFALPSANSIAKYLQRSFLISARSLLQLG